MVYERFNDERLKLGKPPISRETFDRLVRDGRDLHSASMSSRRFNEDTFFNNLLIADLVETGVEFGIDALSLVTRPAAAVLEAGGGSFGGAGAEASFDVVSSVLDTAGDAVSGIADGIGDALGGIFDL